MIRALGAFGVIKLPDVTDILSLADEFRGRLCELYQARHERLIDLRNRLFPRLYAALCDSETLGAKIRELEAEIKKLHAQERNRNVITEEQRERLESLRSQRKLIGDRLKIERTAWVEHQRSFREAFKSAADWKNIKTLAKRRAAYAALSLPPAVAEYGAAWLEFDLAERELGIEFQQRGLHSAIRAEIIEASQPKLKKDAPGMRYQYGRKPRPEPWEKLTLQIPGGLSPEKAFGGTPGLSIERQEGTQWYWVTQQIGTADHPHQIRYLAKLNRPFPEGSKINRWSLNVRRETVVMRNKYGVVREVERQRATVVPILSMPDATKPMGSGTLAYDLSWTVRKSGIQVCAFWSDSVCERLIIPNWLIEKRMGIKEEQALCDLQANAFLSAKGAMPETGKVQGYEALRRYAAEYPEDTKAANLLDDMMLSLNRARRSQKRAVRCIAKIYETVVRRVCSRHSHLVADPIDLSRIKRYDTRDLLREDVLPERSREILHAVAPGKLRALLHGYGLSASDEVVTPPPDDARCTDLFTTWVAELGRKARSGNGETSHRSQSDLQPAGGK